jgi:hypothetical protein
MAPSTSLAQNASTKMSKTKPEYAKYKSMKHFFNHKRLQLLEKTPAHFHFHDRIKPGTPGHRILPFPAGQPRVSRSPEEIAVDKRRRVSRRYLTSLNPEWCLRRRQLVEMWNKDIHTRRQLKDQKTATPKMLALAWEFRLREAVNEDRETAR